MTESTLVESNVLLDTLTDDPMWAEWSSGALTSAFDRGNVLVNPASSRSRWPKKSSFDS